MITTRHKSRLGWPGQAISTRLEGSRPHLCLWTVGCGRAVMNRGVAAWNDDSYAATVGKLIGRTETPGRVPQQES